MTIGGLNVIVTLVYKGGESNFLKKEGEEEVGKKRPTNL